MGCSHKVKGLVPFVSDLVANGKGFSAIPLKLNVLPLKLDESVGESLNQANENWVFWFSDNVGELMDLTVATLATLATCDTCHVTLARVASVQCGALSVTLYDPISGLTTDLSTFDLAAFDHT